jgi:hypothetical protein
LELAALQQASSKAGSLLQRNKKAPEKLRSWELAVLQQASSGETAELGTCCNATSKLRRSSEAPKLWSLRCSKTLTWVKKMNIVI